MAHATDKGRRKLVAGNWKMNGLRRDGEALAKEILERVTDGNVACDVLLCPPATLIMAIGQILAGSIVELGGQDCHTQACGAYTGDISAAMLRDLGCARVIVGHSERRANHAETSAEVHAKAKAAIVAGLAPIICVGESEEERLSGHALDVVRAQIAVSVPVHSAQQLTVAYEPIWAIGSGRTPTHDEIIEMHAAIRSSLAAQIDGGAQIRILYGGSVKASNAEDVLGLEGVDGALIGGASLKAAEFWSIIEAAG